MNVLLIALGSAGDVNPMIRLGAALKGRGRRVTVVASAYFEAPILRAGLDMIALGTIAEYHAATSHPDLWHPRKGPMLVAKHLAIPLIRPLYEIVRRYDPANTVVVSPGIAFGARIAQEKTGMPMATFYLQPAYLRSLYQTPRISGLPSSDWCPRPLKRAVFRSIDRLLDSVFLPEVNALRTELGLPEIGSSGCEWRSCSEWMNAPRLILGLFPDWFAPLQPDWPAQLRLTGFMNCDDDLEEKLSPELGRFLESGEAPILFTAGTAMRRGKRFFEESVKACRLLGRRAILITRFRDQIPGTLPDGVRHFDYAPFSLTLPRVAAVVHHGGIGTIAQALAAGVPQLVAPAAHDQPDNAARVERLGAGASISPRKYRGRLVARKLRRLLDSAAIRLNCESIREKFHEGQAQFRSVGDTCLLIEQLAQ